MLKNYLKTALRSLKKQGVFTIMNVIGLSTGIACFILITLFVRDELTFDRFHKNTDRIYRGISVFKAGFVAGVPDFIVENMKAQMPEVEKAARINFGSRAVMEYEGKQVFENEYYRADPEIFEIFDFSLLYGDEKEALRTDRSIVISQYIMNKYYGGENPIGKTLKMSGAEEGYVITGVLNEIPENSRFRFNLLGRMASADFSTPRGKWRPSGLLYVLLSEGTGLEEFESRIIELAESVDYPSLNKADFRFENYGELYLNSPYSFTASGISGDSDIIWIFTSVGVILLIIACINYINAATARSLNRNREIGVRRAVGATGKQIGYQFLAETFCVTVLAVSLSAALVEGLLPVLNDLSGKSLSMNYFTESFAIPFLVLLVPAITLLAGLYPAFFSSRTKALDLFAKSGKTGKGYMRNSLVVFQFVITLTLIFCTQVILNQVEVLQNTEVGVNTKNVLNPQMPYRYDYDLIKNAFSNVAGVEAVTSAPFPSTSSSSVYISYENEGEMDSLSINPYWVDEHAADFFEMEIIKGSAFDLSGNALHKQQVLISKKVADLLPFEDPIGKQLTVRTDDYKRVKKTIAGVYKDLRFNAKGEAPKTVMQTTENRYSMNLKLSEANQEETVLRLSEAWDELVPNQPFEYSYLEDKIMANYEKERKFGTIFRYFAGIAILIAALGLLGLSAFTIVQKYKEIGIRKVLGATVTNITGVLLRKYLLLILIATLLATPIAYLLMDNWLSEFANRITISAGIFLLGFVLAVLILIVTVGYQTLRAARLNPVLVLKDE